MENWWNTSLGDTVYMTWRAWLWKGCLRTNKVRVEERWVAWEAWTPSCRRVAAISYSDDSLGIYATLS